MIDCHCVGYVEEFNANSKTPRTIQLEITCGGFEEGTQYMQYLGEKQRKTQHQ